jgi:hypothetical protein
VTELTVNCTPTDHGWKCQVTVDDGVSRTEHEVSFTDADLHRYAGPTSDPHLLVNASFRFLLEREPKEAIMRRFELPVITRYFPEYAADIRRRLGRTA